MKRKILVITGLTAIFFACHAGGIDKFIGRYKGESSDTLSIELKSDSTLLLTDCHNSKKSFLTHFLVKGDTLFCSQLFLWENNKYEPVFDGAMKIIYSKSTEKHLVSFRGREDSMRKIK